MAGKRGCLCSVSGTVKPTKQETKLAMFGELALIAQIKTFRLHLHIEESLAFGSCSCIVV